MSKQLEYIVIIRIMEVCSKCSQNSRGRNIYTDLMASEEISKRS